MTNFTIDKNERIVHPGDEIIIENKGKRYLATFVDIDVNEDIIVKLNESNKKYTLDKHTSKEYIVLNETKESLYDDRNSSKNFFTSIANDIMGETMQPLQKDININTLNDYGLLSENSITRDGKKEVELRRLNTLLRSAKILADKHNLNKVSVSITESLKYI